MDQTVLLVLISVLAVVGGVWDLFKRNARDLLGAVLLLGVGMVAGVGLEFLFPGGFLVGVAGGFSVGMPQLLRAEAKRKDATAAALLEAPDPASSLLVVHDRLDGLARHESQRRIHRFGWGLGMAMFALVGMGEIAIGMGYHVWQFLLSGSALLFLPASQLGRAMVDADEREALEARLRRLRSERAGGGRVLPSDALKNAPTGPALDGTPDDDADPLPTR